MAKISVVGSPFVSVLLSDLDQSQRLREHTINPPGQERYLSPIDQDGDLTAYLVGLGGTAVEAELAAFIAATLGADDISVATIRTQADAMTGITGTTVGEGEAIQALISYPLVETGNFLLSFDGGVVSKLVAKGWVKVFTDAGDALFAL